LAARQSASLREDDVDDEVYSVSGDVQFKPFAGVDRELAYPVRHVARTRAVCVHH